MRLDEKIHVSPSRMNWRLWSLSSTMAVRSTVSGGKVEWKRQSQKLKELKHSEPWMLAMV